MARGWQVTLDAIKAKLLRRGRSAEDADDLVQESFLRYYIYVRRRPVASAGAFMSRTAMNLAVDADRARAVRREELLMEDDAIADVSPSLEDRVLARECLARLDDCLDRLDEKTRDIFLDIRVGGMSYAEVARHHRISVSTAEKQVAKATLLIGGRMEGWLK